MAKQCGSFKITGTIDEVCFYRMNGQYYARMKSSLTRGRVKKSPAFRKTREHAAILAEGSKIASEVYRQMRKEDKKHALYREMTGKAILLLREGKTREDIFRRLSSQYLGREGAWQQASELMMVRRKKSSKNNGVTVTAKAGCCLAGLPLKPVPADRHKRRRSMIRRRPPRPTGDISEISNTMGVYGEVVLNRNNLLHIPAF